jgi:membrane protease YdiL (CAAX protease family)
VAEIFGLHFSGIIAWWLWRAIYLSKLPGLQKKARVALDWTLDLIFSKDLVQLPTLRSPTMSEAEESSTGTATEHGKHEIRNSKSETNLADQK